ncbi:tetratricopeptide repeat protein 38-like isoform X2 [Papaver somniferum]|uniref:tetratricopeptide repeat protein 38-like isoform X2 n=1 Tax=Papaver somniferum TaxID=3469 RepID=UPI000E70431C|nr:tetratricopeptide repeat protein 38-like isoform X2 [Papaver somniferum]
MEGNTVKLDKWGYPVRTSSDSCIDAINSYYTEFLSHGRKASVIFEAVTHDESCVLANTLAGYLAYPLDLSKSQVHLSSAKSQLAVFAAVSSLVVKNKDDQLTYDRHSELLEQFPKDLASLKRGHILCFFMGRPDKCLTLVEKVLPQNEKQGYIHGIYCFPLLELGRMEDAEKAAKKGLEINKDDIWSQHGFCHVLQYECRFKEATKFMEENSSSWESCTSFMLTHNWWHVAVGYLDGHSPISKVLEVYDHRIWKELEKSDASRTEVYLNAIGLLMRVYVRGHVISMGHRLKILVDCLTDQSVWHIQWHLDILILWALSRTSKITEAETLLKEMKSRKTNPSLQKGIQLAEGLFEYGQKNYEKAFQLLGPDFDTHDYKIIGASDEQLDVFKEVWYNVLLETGRYQIAIHEIKKQIQKTKGVPFLWHLLGRAYDHEGNKYESYISTYEGKKLESAYF